MAELVHFVKQDHTVRTTASTTAVEVTNYTINWSDLTGAGFAAGDNVAIIVATRLTAAFASWYAQFQIGFGTTYAGRTDDADSLHNWESVNNSISTPIKGWQYLWIDKRALVENQNIYFSLWCSNGSGTSAASENFCCLVLNADDLGTNLLYDEQTHSGNAPTSYGTTGASVTTGASGDWFFIGSSFWQSDSTSDDALIAIQVDGTDYAEINTEGEDTQDQFVQGTMMASNGLASSKVARLRFRTTGGSQDCERSKILALRLDAFKDHVATRTTSTITHSVADTFQEFWGPSYTSSQTGNVFAIGLPIHTTSSNVQNPYGRIQLAGSDWPASGNNRSVARDNSGGGKIGPIVFGYASVSSGSLDFDFDTASETETGYSSTEQVGAIFSLELAGAAAYALDCQPGSLAVSGVTATTAAGRNFDAQPGTLALTGFTATLARGYFINAAAGSFALSGTDATLARGHAFNAAAGSFALDGTAATLAATISINAGPGTFALTGFDATLSRGYAFNAAAGSFALTGTDATFVAPAFLNAEPASYTLNGVAMTPVATRSFDAQPGSFTVTGIAATLAKSFEVNAAPGSYSVDGIAATLAAARFFDAQPATFALTGIEAALSRGRVIDAAVGSFALNGVAATFSRALVADAQPGAFTLTGIAAGLTYAPVYPLVSMVAASMASRTTSTRPALEDPAESAASRTTASRPALTPTGSPAASRTTATRPTVTVNE